MQGIETTMHPSMVKQIKFLEESKGLGKKVTLCGRDYENGLDHLPAQLELCCLHKILRLYLFNVHPIPSTTTTGWMSLCFEVMNGESAACQLSHQMTSDIFSILLANEPVRQSVTRMSRTEMLNTKTFRNNKTRTAFYEGYATVVNSDTDTKSI